MDDHILQVSMLLCIGNLWGNGDKKLLVSGHQTNDASLNISHDDPCQTWK